MSAEALSKIRVTIKRRITETAAEDILPSIFQKKTFWGVTFFKYFTLFRLTIFHLLYHKIFRGMENIITYNTSL